MKEQEYNKAIAMQESINDQLVTELQYVDELLRAVGFEEGLSSLKAVAEEMVLEVSTDSEDLES